MKHVPSKIEWQLMLDYTFIRNCMPENTPTNFRRTHTKGFLHMLHSELDLDEDTLTRMRTNSPQFPINVAYYEEKIEEYYVKCGVSLHHILIATQTNCVVCGSLSKPEPSKMKTVYVYTSLNKDPQSGTVMPTRCTKTTCRHRGHYGWDLVPGTLANRRLFQPLKNRHTLPYWVCSTRTAFVTSMISKDMLPQVLWNHAGSLNMANQGNWLLGHPEKLSHTDAHSGQDGIREHANSMRVGIERRQLQRAFLQYLYHRTVISMGGSMQLLSCSLLTSRRKPSLNELAGRHQCAHVWYVS